jgi:uncharacterized protein
VLAITQPARCRAVIALLHPADDSSWDQPLFRHLDEVLPKSGIAVVRYDRRPAPGDSDVPLDVQVDDLRDALAETVQQVGPVPTGLFGFSQGAWVALLAAAADPALAFLVVVGCSTVSPAEQMRFGAAQQLREAGYGPGALAELARLRAAWEKFQRGTVSREVAQRVIDALADRPWYPMSWVPAVLPATPGWFDMDFDPAVPLRRIQCPVLAFYGDDEWVPVADSVGVWRREYPHPDRLTIHYLPGTGHYPMLSGPDQAVISPDYEEALLSWLNQVLAERPTS